MTLFTRRRAGIRGTRRMAVGMVLALCAFAGLPAALTPEASAQALPDANLTSDGRMAATYVNGRFTLTDTIEHRPIFQSTSTRLVMDQQVTPTIRMVPRPGGADIIYTYTNNTDRALRLGKLSLPGLRMPGTIQLYRSRQDTYTETFDNFRMAESIYPNGTYSPVQVVQDDRHIVGVSLLYNAVEYNHPVQLCIASPQRYPGDNGQHWLVEFRFTHDYFVATFPAGTTRTYTLAVRAVPRDQSWLKTVTPYRDYFRGLYGPVDYARDARPVVGEAISSAQNCSEGNPRGFNQPQLRPDVNGWSAWANRLRTYPGMGYHRVMMWAPSGCFRQHPQFNFPFQFMTGMNLVPRMRDTFPAIRSAASSDLATGFWWGRSVNIMRGWDQGAVGSENLDPSNPEHVRLAFNELDMAVAGGATMLGMDAYVPLYPGTAYRWMQRLKEHAPTIKFITENASSDLIHNLTPTFHEASRIHSNHVFADFINPGHETWAAISSVHDANGNIINAPTLQQRVGEMRRIANLGFVPLIYGPTIIPSDLVSVDTSRTSVPRELQAMQSTGGGSSLISRARERRADGQRVIVVPTGGQ